MLSSSSGECVCTSFEIRKTKYPGDSLSEGPESMKERVQGSPRQARRAGESWTRSQGRVGVQAEGRGKNEAVGWPSLSESASLCVFPHK